MRVFGEIAGYPEGSVFDDRQQLRSSGVHIHNQAGISGSQVEGADSIVVSGGYEDDEDNGAEIIYTGEGGRDPNTGRQIADQEFKRGNRALHKSMTEGLPVRVIRGARLNSEFAPETGYRYDGLYRVEDSWHEPGRSGHQVWRFRLIKLSEGDVPSEKPSRQLSPQRVETHVQRIVRDTELGRRVKKMHRYHCQVCGLRLEGPSGPYSEAAHIRPLGRPHEGPDTNENILCLCPNHHVLFDLGAFSIDDDGTLLGLCGQLRTTKGHEIASEYLRYHREHYDFELGKT
jgi:putative restriction endonuclease